MAKETSGLAPSPGLGSLPRLPEGPGHWLTSEQDAEKLTVTDPASQSCWVGSSPMPAWSEGRAGLWRM